MAKITIAGDAAVVTSAMKLEDIKTIVGLPFFRTQTD